MKSPIDVYCRFCAALPGNACGKVGVHSSFRPVKYFHGPRWRDYNRHRSDQMKIEHWKARYGGASDVPAR